MYNLINIIKSHAQRYPKSETTDFLKLIYQQTFGAGHMVSDEVNSLNKINDEAQKNLPILQSYTEDIGGDKSRFYIQAVRDGYISASTLNRIFILGATEGCGDFDSFYEKVRILKELSLKNASSAEIDAFISQWEISGQKPFSHSEAYRCAYSPAYRVVEGKYAKYAEIFSRIDNILRENSHCIVAIDGKSASGKSTLGIMLSKVYDLNLVHMDNFFLTPKLRTQKRLDEIGGNVDYERFLKEVIIPLAQKQNFAYTPYLCQSGIMGEAINFTKKPLTVVEGSYSLHPHFEEYADLSVYLDIDHTLQVKRIRERNGAVMLKRFVHEWIPMENSYAEHFKVKERANLVFGE